MSGERPIFPNPLTKKAVTKTAAKDEWPHFEDLTEDDPAEASSSSVTAS